MGQLPKDGLMIVDDAHGAGVLGRTGRGTLELEGVDRRRIVQCITLSKAFGVFGGAILGSSEVRERIFRRSRMFIGSTPLPLPLANAALAALKVVKTDRNLRLRLNRNAAYVKSELRKAGRALADTPSPIIPVRCANEKDAAALKRKLLAAGIYPPFVNYPGGPPGGLFRFVISSEHSRSQLDQLIGVLVQKIP